MSAQKQDPNIDQKQINSSVALLLQDKFISSKLNKRMFYVIVILALVVIYNSYSVGKLAHSIENIDIPVLALTHDFRVMELPKLSESHFPAEHVGKWLRNNQDLLYTFNYNSVRREWPNALTQIMTEGAKKAWIDGLHNSGLIPRVRGSGKDSERLFVEAAMEAPTFVKEGKLKNSKGVEVAVWQFYTSGIIRLTNGVANSRNSGVLATQKVSLSITIIRTHFNVKKDGLEIARIVIEANK